MQIGTAVFKRIVRETHNNVYEKAVKVVADTMEQTYRFGCFKRDYIEGCAKYFVDKELDKC